MENNENDEHFFEHVREIDDDDLINGIDFLDSPGLRIKIHLATRFGLTRNIRLSDTCSITILELGVTVKASELNCFKGPMTVAELLIEMRNALILKQPNYQDKLTRDFFGVLCSHRSVHIVFDDPKGEIVVESLFNQYQDEYLKVSHYQIDAN